MNEQELIDELKERVRYLENLHDSLRKEIRSHKKEISVLRAENKMLLQLRYQKNDQL